MAERGDGVPGAGITRGRFLVALAVAGIAGGGVLGCGAVGRVRSLYPPRPGGGEWVFRSRLDLRPPAVSVARRSDRTAPGYVFVAPKNGPGETGPGQRGPLIVDEDGQPVWFRPLQDGDADAMDFKAQRYKGESVLTWWQGPHTTYGLGEYAVLDGSYGEVARVRPTATSRTCTSYSSRRRTPPSSPSTGLRRTTSPRWAAPLTALRRRG